MKIVDRASFLALPDGTVFAKVADQSRGVTLGHDNLAIKGRTLGLANDFVVQDLGTSFDCQDSEEWMEAWDKMFAGEASPPLDYTFCGRDGSFMEEQLFLIWERDDHRRLIERLQQAFGDAHEPANES